MKSIRFWSVIWSLAAASLLYGSKQANAELAFYDTFETGTIGTNPTTPIVGLPWTTFAATDNNTVQANPLVSGNDSSAQVLRVQRGAGLPAGREFLDITAAQSAQLAAGSLMTIQFKHYQPDPNTKSIAVLLYEDTNHNFLNNEIDLEFLGGRALKYYSNAINNFVDTGLTGTSGWDDVTVVVDYIADTWSVSLNGGAPVSNLPFVDGVGHTTGASILFGPSSSPVLGYVDDVKVYVGAVPEPASAVLLGIAACVATLISTSRNNRRSS